MRAYIFGIFEDDLIAVFYKQELKIFIVRGIVAWTPKVLGVADILKL
jgi:hypothetical protein